MIGGFRQTRACMIGLLSISLTATRVRCLKVKATDDPMPERFQSKLLGCRSSQCPRMPDARALVGDACGLLPDSVTPEKDDNG